MELTLSMQKMEKTDGPALVCSSGSMVYQLLGHHCMSHPTWIQAGLQTTVSLPHHLHCLAGSCVLMMFLLTTLLAVFPRLLMQLLSADLLDCPGKGVGAPATDGWNTDEKG